MKGMICYDTKYGSTTSLCEAIKRGMDFDVEIKNVTDVEYFQHDVIVIVTPIFIGKPMKSVAKFIEDNYKELEGKNIVVIVTCWAASTKYRESAKEFIELIIGNLPTCNLICARALPGKLLMEDIAENDKKALLRIIRRISQRSEEFSGDEIIWGDARDYSMAEQLGREIKDRMYRLK